MRVLDLFSGIGGFSLGLERTGGFKTVAFCEIDPYCRKILAKHWPGVPCYHDIRELTGDRLRADGIAVDVICGGFPCQDISLAGKGAGINGERSGLWSEYARIVGEVRPRYVLVENVAALLSRGLDAVLGDLATLGFDAEWHCIPASAVGAPHRRDRVWIIAHAAHKLPHGSGEIRSRWRPQLTNSDWWSVEPDVCRVAHGVSARVDRLKGLGNAVVPQIPELIGNAILASINQRREHELSGTVAFAKNRTPSANESLDSQPANCSGQSSQTTEAFATSAKGAVSGT